MRLPHPKRRRRAARPLTAAVLAAPAWLAVASMAAPATPLAAPTAPGAQPAVHAAAYASPAGPRAAAPDPSPTPEAPAPAPQPPPTPPDDPPDDPTSPSDPPTPTPTPAPPPPDDPGEPGGGLFGGLGDLVTDTLDAWFASLVESALNPVLDVFGHTVLATPDVTAQPRVRELWMISAGIANTAYLLLIVVGGVVVMSHETLQIRYAFKDIAARLVVGAVAANTSLWLAGEAIRFGNAVTAAALGPGVDPRAAAATLRTITLAAVVDRGRLLILLGLVAAVLALIVLATFIVRVALVVLLVVAAPLALACHALPHTEGAAQLWWRAFTGCFAVQLGQALTLVAALRIFLSDHVTSVLSMPGSAVVDLLVVCCLLYILVRIPGWTARMVFRGRPSTMVRVAQYTFWHRMIRSAQRGGKAGKAAGL